MPRTAPPNQVSVTVHWDGDKFHARCQGHAAFSANSAERAAIYAAALALDCSSTEVEITQIGAEELLDGEGNMMQHTDWDYVCRVKRERGN